ncbi:PHP domain-containing protein, partial [Salibacteraceae bacterium]|nr:PHP domain-containing protein [Salibacteraceae bacterium]
MLLNCHSYYSLNYGCLSVEDVLQTIKDLGHANFVITDINNTSETFRFLMRAEEYGIKANIGIDFRNGVHQQYIGIAKNKKGFFELNEHLSHH